MCKDNALSLNLICNFKLQYMDLIMPNIEIKTKIFIDNMSCTNIFSALHNDQPNKADEIHKALMVDHVSAVCTWMSGVKQLIYHCIARSELLDIDKKESEE